MTVMRSIVCSLAALVCCAGSVLGVGGSDTCETAELVTGPQAVSIDTTSTVRPVNHEGKRATCDRKTGVNFWNSVDVWYDYVAAGTGPLNIAISGCASTINSSGASGISVWSDCNTEIACNTNTSAACSSSVQINAVAGTHYLVRVATFATSSSGTSVARRGTATLTFTEIQPPTNEACGSAAQKDGPGTLNWNDTLAQADGPLPACTDEPAQRDLWYRYTPTITSGLAVISASATNIWISVHDDTCAPTATYACAAGPATIQVTPGASYRVRIARAASAASGNGSITFTEYASPTNDTCEAPREVTVGEYDWDDSGATAHGPFPSCVYGTPETQRDVWFAYTASVTGNATVDCRLSTAAAPGTNNSTVISVHSACATGAEMTCASPQGAKRWVCFPVVGGQRYLIRLGRLNSAARESWKVKIAEFATPPGDTWQTAAPLTLGTTSYTTVGACDKDEFETNTACRGATSPGAGKWFYFEPSEPGIAVFDATAGTVDTFFRLYGADSSGNCTGQILECSSDMGQSTKGAYISIPVTGTERLYLHVDTQFASSNHIHQAFTLTTDVLPPYGNDDCAGAFALVEGTTTFDTREASNSAGVPDPTCNVGGNLGVTRHDLWYSWTSPANGKTRISTCRNPAPLLGSNATVLTIYNNCTLSTQVDCNDDATDRTDTDWAHPCTDEQSALQFNSRRNTTYLVRVAAHQEFFGPGVLNVSFVADECQADFNQNGVLNIDDIFIFLNAWFAGDPATDVDGNGINVDDIFIYLNRWFQGC